MCFGHKKTADSSIDLPVIKLSAKDAVKAYQERKKEQKLCGGYKTPVTKRNVDNFVDRQYIDEACNPREYRRGAKTAKWVDGTEQDAIEPVHDASQS